MVLSDDEKKYIQNIKDNTDYSWLKENKSEKLDNENARNIYNKVYNYN